MTKKLYLFPIILFLLILNFIACDGSGEEEASALMAEGIKLLKAARAKEADSYADAYKLYIDARAIFEKIKKDYPGSEAGRNIASGPRFCMGNTRPSRTGSSRWPKARRRREIFSCPSHR